MDSAPKPNLKRKSFSWSLWENISKNNHDFGNPEKFSSNIKET
jgi:myosin-crossreactive antigen